MPGPLGEKEVRSRQGRNGVFRGSEKERDFFWGENGSAHMATLVLIERPVMLHYPIKKIDIRALEIIYISRFNFLIL